MLFCFSMSLAFLSCDLHIMSSRIFCGDFVIEQPSLKSDPEGKEEKRYPSDEKMKA